MNRARVWTAIRTPPGLAPSTSGFDDPKPLSPRLSTARTRAPPPRRLADTRDSALRVPRGRGRRTARRRMSGWRSASRDERRSARAEARFRRGRGHCAARRVLRNPLVPDRRAPRRRQAAARTRASEPPPPPTRAMARLRLHDAQLRVRRGERALVVGEQLLVELLARPQAGELDAHVALGESPDSRISSRARSTIFTGSPMSSTKISPPRPISPACSTSCAASGIDMK